MNVALRLHGARYSRIREFCNYKFRYWNQLCNEVQRSCKFRTKTYALVELGDWAKDRSARYRQPDCHAARNALNSWILAGTPSSNWLQSTYVCMGIKIKYCSTYRLFNNSVLFEYNLDGLIVAVPKVTHDRKSPSNILCRERSIFNFLNTFHKFPFPLGLSKERAGKGKRWADLAQLKYPRPSGGV